MKNFLYTLVLFLAVSPVLLVADAVGVALRHPQVRHFLGLSHSTEAIESFAYGPLRSGNTSASLNANNFSPLMARTLRNTQNATGAMPLYLNTKLRPIPGLARELRLLFFGTNDGYFQAYDADRETTLWSLPLPRGLTVASTAVMNTEKNKIYFLASGRDEEAISPLHLRLFAVSLDGQHIDSREVALNEILTEDSKYLAASLECRSALGLEQGKKPTIYFACSENGDSIPAHTRKRHIPKIHGLWVFVPLESTGNLAATPIDTFSNPLYAPGMGNDGSAPPLLPDNSLLLSTKQEASCCVLHLQSAAQFCLDNTKHLACPSPSTIAQGKRLFAFYPGTDGKLYSFDPLTLSKPAENALAPNGSALHGLVPSYLQSPNELRVVVAGEEKGPLIREFHVATDHSLEELWSYAGNPELSLTLNHAVIAQNPSRTHALYLTLAQESRTQRSHLLVLDANRGQLLQDISLDGSTSLTMPLLVDEEIYISTAANGIIQVARAASFSKIFLEDSYFQGLWRNLFAKRHHI